MAIMTGVQSAQVLGPSTQKQADKSRQQMGDVDPQSFDASKNFENNQTETKTHGGSSGNDRGGNKSWNATSDGGQDQVEKNNGLDVIR